MLQVVNLKHCMPPVLKQVDLDIEAPKGDKATSLDNLSLLGRTLLLNAASLRVVRGQTHCAFCRGTGRETCTACAGSGLVQHQDKVRMNSVRHAGKAPPPPTGLEAARVGEALLQPLALTIAATICLLRHDANALLSPLQPASSRCCCRSSSPR